MSLLPPTFFCLTDRFHVEQYFADQSNYRGEVVVVAAQGKKAFD